MPAPSRSLLRFQCGLRASREERGIGTVPAYPCPCCWKAEADSDALLVKLGECDHWIAYEATTMYKTLQCHLPPDRSPRFLLFNAISIHVMPIYSPYTKKKFPIRVSCNGDDTEESEDDAEHRCTECGARPGERGSAGSGCYTLAGHPSSHLELPICGLSHRVPR